MASDRQRLVKLFDEMSQQHRQSLLDYASFLHQQSAAQAPAEKLEPIAKPRPEKENVVNAIKRLRASYFMLDSDKLLNETSSLMAQFIGEALLFSVPLQASQAGSFTFTTTKPDWCGR